MSHVALQGRIEIACRAHGTRTAPDCSACARVKRIDAAYGELLEQRRKFTNRLNAELAKGELVIVGLA